MKKIIKTVKAKVAPKKSEEHLAYKAFLEQYAKDHPAKYEAKKEALLAKLNTL